MVLFFIGVVEMIIAATWTKVVSTSKVWPSGFITMVNIMIWYYVLQAIIEDIANWRIVIVYALGCAVGTMLTTHFFSRREKVRRSRGRKTSNQAEIAYVDNSPIREL
jgi:hypothetical protein